MEGGVNRGRTVRNAVDGDGVKAVVSTGEEAGMRGGWTVANRKDASIRQNLRWVRRDQMRSGGLARTRSVRLKEDRMRGMTGGSITGKWVDIIVMKS